MLVAFFGQTELESSKVDFASKNRLSFIYRLLADRSFAVPIIISSGHGARLPETSASVCSAAAPLSGLIW